MKNRWSYHSQKKLGNLIKSVKYAMFNEGTSRRMKTSSFPNLETFVSTEQLLTQKLHTVKQPRYKSKDTAPKVRQWGIQTALTRHRSQNRNPYAARRPSEAPSDASPPRILHTAAHNVPPIRHVPKSPRAPKRPIRKGDPGREGPWLLKGLC